MARLRAGLHGSAERDARGVTVYLLPGLTGRQRQAVLRRLRQEASRGFGPPLPLPGLVLALGRDRLRVAAVTLLAIVRLHPTAALLPGAAAAAMTLFVLASAGGALGPAPRPALAGEVASHGRLASTASRVVGGSGVISPAQGGSGLGSGVPAPVWARPRKHPGHHGAGKHGAKHGAGHHGASHHRASHHGTVERRATGQCAGQPACRAAAPS